MDRTVAKTLAECQVGKLNSRECIAYTYLHTEYIYYMSSSTHHLWGPMSAKNLTRPRTLGSLLYPMLGHRQSHILTHVDCS
jgi:hypothetical protein